MPIVTLVIGPNSSIPVEDLKIFCQEIVPAVLRDREHLLATGEIQFVAYSIDDEEAITVGHLFKIEAEPSNGRSNRRYVMMNGLAGAFTACFGKTESAVFALYLSLDGYISTNPVEMPFVEDMSVGAAIERVCARISYLNEV